MPDGRFLSKSIAYSAQVGSVSLEADYLFMRMIPHLDSSGRMTGEPMSVKALCCPLRNEMTGDVVERCLGELRKAKLIVWYEVAGEKYVEFPRFTSHQRGARLDREAPSRLPAPKPDKVRTTPDNSGEWRVSKEKLSEVKRSEVKLSKEKKTARRPASQATPEQLSWLALVAGAYEQRKGPGSFPYGKAGKLLKPLHDAGHSGEEIAIRLGRYIDWLDNPKFLSLQKFRETFGDYAEKEPATFRALDGYPDLVRDGVMTEYGERVTRPPGLRIA